MTKDTRKACKTCGTKHHVHAIGCPNQQLHVDQIVALANGTTARIISIDSDPRCDIGMVIADDQDHGIVVARQDVVSIVGWA